jgi:ribokinase
MNDKVYKQNAIKCIDVVDTTAAGDTFIGYFVYGLSKGMQPQEVLKLASKAASICIGRSGAAVSIPKLDELN